MDLNRQYFDMDENGATVPPLGEDEKDIIAPPPGDMEEEDDGSEIIAPPEA